MAKKNKLLLIVLAAAIVILGGLAALLLLNPEEEKEPEIYVPIITTELSNIQKIEIDNTPNMRSCSRATALSTSPLWTAFACLM